MTTQPDQVMPTASEQIPTLCPTFCTAGHAPARQRGDGVFHEAAPIAMQGLSPHALPIAEVSLRMESWEDGEGLLHGAYVRISVDDGQDFASVLVASPQDLAGLAARAMAIAAELADHQAAHVASTGRELVCFPA